MSYGSLKRWVGMSGSEVGKAQERVGSGGWKRLSLNAGLVGRIQRCGRTGWGNGGERHVGLTGSTGAQAASPLTEVVKSSAEREEEVVGVVSLTADTGGRVDAERATLLVVFCKYKIIIIIIIKALTTTVFIVAKSGFCTEQYFCFIISQQHRPTTSHHHKISEHKQSSLFLSISFIIKTFVPHYQVQGDLLPGRFCFNHWSLIWAIYLLLR